MLLQCVSICNTHEVDTTDELQYLLNNSSSEDTVIILLDSSIEYTLSGLNYYINKSITIASRDEITVNISCHNDGGLAFMNSQVSLYHLQFKRCGANVTQLPPAILDTVGHTGTHHVTALLLVNCTVNTDWLVIQSAIGFSIIGCDLYTTCFHNTYIGDSIAQLSGVLLRFSDTVTFTHTTVELLNVTFQNNTNLHYEECIHDNYLRGKYSYNKYYAAGLTIHYTRKQYTPEVTITNGTFIQNTGTTAGAVLIITYKDAVSVTSITGIVFHNNALTTTCHAVDIQFYHFGGAMATTGQLFTIQNCTFQRGTPNVRHTSTNSAVGIGLYPINYTIDLNDLYFTGYRTPAEEGTCLRVQLFKHTTHRKTHSGNVNLMNITAINNSGEYNATVLPKSLFYFENIKKVTFSGVGIFINNLGSVIHAVETNLHMTGRMTFDKNTAENGAAIHLYGTTQLYLTRGLTALFSNNRAHYSGGAIYAKSSSYSKCVLQLYTDKAAGYNITLVNNMAAAAGNAVFMSPISRCAVHGVTHSIWLTKYIKHLNILQPTHQENSNGLLQISTLPDHLVILFKTADNQYKPPLRGMLNDTYPGEMFHTKILAADALGRKVFSFVLIKLYIASNDLWLQQSGGTATVEGNNTATTLSLVIHAGSNNSTSIQTKLLFSITDIFEYSYNLNVLPCPLGFQLAHGSCQCSSILYQYMPGVKCYIDQKVINRNNNQNTWLGAIDTSTVAVSTDCPSTYCSNDPRHKYIKFPTNLTAALLTDSMGQSSHPLCTSNRNGTLCGGCIDGYSVVFGSDMCKECSNAWIVTIIVYVTMGPLLIYVLYKLRLTLATGTINSIVFYAQASNAGLIEHMTQPHTHTYTLNTVYRSILLFINLNLGFPLCFYNNMTQVWKTALSLLFPVYLLTIVIAIIVISRRSTWLSNRTADQSVQVLVTVVHLSFSKLLATSIQVFTAATVHTDKEQYRVWQWDGRVIFLGPQHYPLAIVTVAIVTLLLIPYMVILIMGKPFTRCSKRANSYLRPIVETVHGPYRSGQHYWFVAKLILLIALYTLYVVQSHGNLGMVSLVVLLSFTMAQALARPFKQPVLNVTECWLLVNITVVYNTLWNNVFKTYAVYNTVAITLAMLTFCFILLYHLITTNTWTHRKYGVIINRIKPMLTIRSREQRRTRPLHYTGSYYTSCTQYREPLIITEVSCD